MENPKIIHKKTLKENDIDLMLKFKKYVIYDYFFHISLLCIILFIVLLNLFNSYIINIIIFLLIELLVYVVSDIGVNRFANNLSNISNKTAIEYTLSFYKNYFIISGLSDKDLKYTYIKIRKGFIYNDYILLWIPFSIIVIDKDTEIIEFLRKIHKIKTKN